MYLLIVAGYSLLSSACMFVVVACGWFPCSLLRADLPSCWLCVCRYWHTWWCWHSWLLVVACSSCSFLVSCCLLLLACCCLSSAACWCMFFVQCCELLGYVHSPQASLRVATLRGGIGEGRTSTHGMYAHEHAFINAHAWPYANQCVHA